MRWKTKARIQNAVSLIPSSVSYATYYWLQRHFGGLRKINPERKLEAAVETWNFIRDAGCDPVDRVFLEIGTGRVPNVPISFWLMGAKRTITIDLNPYMKRELIVEALEYLAQNREHIEEIFGSLLIKNRFEELLNWGKNGSFDIDAFLESCGIEYIAPGDAAETGLPDLSVDFHTSRNVLEHIPPPKLRRIIEEGNRIVRENGLFVHKIDYSDHFSHSDRSITSINFLQFSDVEWEKYAGNRYMYMNRLRHDDFVTLFDSLGHCVLRTEPFVDQRALAVLENGSFELDEKFRIKSIEALSITGSWIVTQNCG